MGACTLLWPNERTPGPADIRLAPRAHLKLARDLVFLPPAEGVKLMQRMGDRPGAKVLGVVLTTDETPRMLILFDAGRDARGLPKIELVGWDDAPDARSYIEELFLAQPELCRRN